MTESTATLLEIVAALPSGPERDAALSKLLPRMRSRLERFIRGKVRDLKTKDDTSDVVHDALLQIFIHFDQFDGRNGASFTTWCHSIVKTQIAISLRRYRQQRRDIGRETRADDESIPEPAEDDSPPLEKLIHEEKLDELKGVVLSVMHEKDREILWLKYYDHLSNKEIAKELQINLGAVRKRVSRALRRLRGMLED